MLSRRTLLFEEAPLLPLPFLLTPPFETNDEADWMGSLAFQRLKNHKEGRIFLLAKFRVFLGSADLLDTLFLRLSFLHFGIPKAIWKIFEMAVD